MAEAFALRRLWSCSFLWCATALECCVLIPLFSITMCPASTGKHAPSANYLQEGLYFHLTQCTSGS